MNLRKFERHFIIEVKSILTIHNPNMPCSKRIYTRVPDLLRVRIAGSSYEMEDLSLGGFRVRGFAVPCSIGDLFECEINLPTDSGSVPVRLEAEVRRIDLTQHELAIRIREISDRDFELLARHVDSLISVALRESEEAKSNFMATINHELNTPLNAILGFSELGMATAQDFSVVRGYFDSIHNAGKRLHDFLTSTMDLASIDQLTVSRECRPTLAKEIIDPVINQLCDMASEKNIKVTDDSIEENVVMFVARKYAMKALFEIGQNAIMHTPSGGKVSFESAYLDDGVLAITVSDSGVGIHKEKLRTIFQPFSKGGGDYAATGDSGPGLGLTIASRLARLMGGSVSATSVEGVGSNFTLSLPMVHRIGILPRDTPEWKSSASFVSASKFY